MLEVGEEYQVEHRRKGTFKMRVIEDGEVWVTGIITKGEVRSRAGWKGVGWEITVRKSFAVFNLIDSGGDSCESVSAGIPTDSG